MQILRPDPELLNQQLWAWGQLAIHAGTSLLDDSDALTNVRHCPTSRLPSHRAHSEKSMLQCGRTPGLECRRNFGGSEKLFIPPECVGLEIEILDSETVRTAQLSKCLFRKSKPRFSLFFF